MTTHIPVPGAGHLGAGLFSVVFWLRALLALLYIGVPVLLAGTSVWWATHRARLDVPAGPVRRARVARLAGLAAGLIVGVLAIWFGQALLAPATVAVGYLFGVLTAELLGVPQPSGPLRVAALQTRYARRYAPQWSAPVLLSAGVLAVAAPAVLAVLPMVRYGPWNPDGKGARFTLPGAALHWPAAASVPPAAVAALALVVGGIALRRVALLPPVAVEQTGLDERARRNSARAVVAAVLAVELFVLAAATFTWSRGSWSGPASAWPSPLSWCGA